MSRKPQALSGGSQDVASLRPGQEKQALRSEFQKAKAETVRRAWLIWTVIALILLTQVALTLRMDNSASEEEALYLYVGHLEIAHWLHGAALQGNYPSYFSGAPVLYPVLGAAADSIGGLAAARAVSLVEMLVATTLVYAMTKRMFDDRVALCAVLVFAVAEPTLYLGNLATSDASALCLLAVAAWLVVRTARFRWPVYLLAAPVMLGAVATKYATLLFIPSVIALVGLSGVHGRGMKVNFGRPAALAALFAALSAGLAYLAGPDYIGGFKFTTLDLFGGTNSTSSLLWDRAQWIGVPLVLAVVGAVAYTRHPAIDAKTVAPAAGTWLHRALLGLVLGGTLLLAPIEQIRIHSETSLSNDVGFGLVIAAPVVGFGLARLIGDYFRHIQIGIAVWGLALTVGMTAANNQFKAWPNSALFVSDMSHYLRPGARYLVEADEVPIYYLRHYSDAQRSQFTSTYHIAYYDGAQRKLLADNAGYVAAIKAGYFQVVAYDYQITPAVDAVLAQTLARSADYRLANVISYGNGTMRQYIWVKIS